MRFEPSCADLTVFVARRALADAAGKHRGLLPPSLLLEPLQGDELCVPGPGQVAGQDFVVRLDAREKA